MINREIWGVTVGTPIKPQKVVESVEGIEKTENKVAVLDDKATNEQYPTAKAVNERVKSVESQLEGLETLLASI